MTNTQQDRMWSRVMLYALAMAIVVTLLESTDDIPVPHQAWIGLAIAFSMEFGAMLVLYFITDSAA